MNQRSHNKICGLCICHNVTNHGSMLQCLATLKALEKRKIPFEIIRYQKKIAFFEKVMFIPRLLNVYLIEDKIKSLSRAINLKINSTFAAYRKKRSEAVNSFKEKYFSKHFSPICLGYNNLVEYSKKYSAILTGSDQLWSPSGLPTNFYNLMFASDNTLKISYASSFGTSKIPFYQKKRTRQFLNRINYISVREISGKKIIKELTGKDVPVVVDPTLLLTKDEWAKIIPVKKIYDEPYILAYLLGTSKTHRARVLELSKKINLKIVALHHLDQYVKADDGFGDYTPANIGAEEFVNLVRHASFVCTDSFHGSIFSIIHHKQFITFNRYSDNAIVSKNTRIDSLFSNLGIINRRYKNDLFNEIQEPLNFTIIDEKLDNLRNESEKYLDKAFKSMMS